MRFVLLGNHPDGLAVAKALCATGRHELAAVQAEQAPAFASNAIAHSDLEEVLATPNIDWVIVAGAMSVRAEQLRRALQSEHHVVCVHPSSDRPDSAYEAALIRDDTRHRLLPTLPDALHPAYRRLRELLDDENAGFRGEHSPFRFLECELWSTREFEAERNGPAWSVLRFLAGEIIEVSGLAVAEEIEPAKPVTVSGVFEKGGLFEARILPGALEDRKRLTIHGERAIAILDGPNDPGRATLRWRMRDGEWQEQSWAEFDRWRPIVEIMESSETEWPALSWQDEVRFLELADGLRRSVEKRRTSGLEYQEISEEVGSKGTLTLIGCAMIWVILLLFMLSIWVPWLRWGVVPLIVGFLILVGLSMLARNKPTPK
jgi:predicted dehydrogenase